MAGDTVGAMRFEEPVEGDAFGAALLSHLEHGDDGFHMIERDDGFVEVASASVYFGDIDAWSAGESQAIEMATGRVLDVGAGAGRLTLYLQERGIDATALDVSAGAIEVCRRRGVRQVWHGTLEDLAASSPERFDTFAFFGNNLGMIGSTEAAAGWFEALRRLANPGARVIGTTLDPYVTKDPDHLRYHEWNRRRGRMPGHLTVRLRYRAQATPWFDLLWVSIDELRAIVEPLGWEMTSDWHDGPLQTVILKMR